MRAHRFARGEIRPRNLHAQPSRSGMLAIYRWVRAIEPRCGRSSSCRPTSASSADRRGRRTTPLGKNIRSQLGLYGERGERTIRFAICPSGVAPVDCAVERHHLGRVEPRSPCDIWRRHQVEHRHWFTCDRLSPDPTWVVLHDVLPIEIGRRTVAETHYPNGATVAGVASIHGDNRLPWVRH